MSHEIALVLIILASTPRVSDSIMNDEQRATRLGPYSLSFEIKEAPINFLIRFSSRYKVLSAGAFLYPRTTFNAGVF